MQGTHTWRHAWSIALLVALIATTVSACGSSGSTQSGTGSGGGNTATVGGIKQTGPGMTEPTTGTGSRIRGGVVTFAETPGSAPNYIAPMYPAEYCDTQNIGELSNMLYRPLYWIGNNYSLSVDYNDSIGQKPIYSNGGKTVTIHLNHYKWSNGEPVSARDLVFWLNVMKADPGSEWCDYVPGKFPDNVTSYEAVNPTTFRLTFNRAYNPTWILFNELEQLVPMPMAWDRTSLSQKAPAATAAHLPDTTKAGAAAVWKFLNTQSQKINDWGSSPLWRVVDGPWKVQSTTSNGGVTFVPNAAYSGTPKASIAKFVEVPFTSESAMINQIKASGPSSTTIAYIPAQYQPLTAAFKSAGYDVNLASMNASALMFLNMNAPKVGMIFRQLYFRQAFQHLVDQNGWIKTFLHGTGVPTYGPVPTVPKDPAMPSTAEKDLYPFSVADAAKLLTDNGWKVTPGGVTTCVKPGTATGECGAGITKGEGITFNLDYASGLTVTQEEMEDLASQAAKVGIKLQLTTHPINDVAAAVEHCAKGTPSCHWTAENYGSGWGYGTTLPTGDGLYYSTSLSNLTNYDNPKMNGIIERSLQGPASQQAAAMRHYIAYASEQVPYVWMPQAVNMYGGATAGELIDSKLGGFAANAAGELTPEFWYLTK